MEHMKINLARQGDVERVDTDAETVDTIYGTSNKQMTNRR